MEPFGTFAQYTRLKVRVSDSNFTVIRAAYKRIAASNRTAPSKRQARHAFYKGMLSHHENARKLSKQFRL